MDKAKMSFRNETSLLGERNGGLMNQVLPLVSIIQNVVVVILSVAVLVIGRSGDM